MENNSYYLHGEGEHSLVSYTYNELVYAINSGTIPQEETILIIDNLLQTKRYVPAKYLIK